MKRLATLLLMASATCALAGAETATRLDDPSLYLPAGLGKQVDVRFSEAFAKGRLAKTDFDGVVMSELPAGQVCLFGRNQGLDPDDAKLKDVARADQGDICAPLADVSVRVKAQVVADATPVPFYGTDKTKCTWAWKTGKGIGLWSEDCKFDTGHWSVAYDEAADQFTLSVDGGDPYPVLRQFRVEKGQGPDSLLPALKAKGLVLDSGECHFAPYTEQTMPKGWAAWNVVPVGKLKQDFAALPKDDVPEPPCGDLGMTVDSIGFFMISAEHPERILHVDLGQDGTMFDPYSIKLE